MGRSSISPFLFPRSRTTGCPSQILRVVSQRRRNRSYTATMKQHPYIRIPLQASGATSKDAIVSIFRGRCSKRGPIERSHHKVTELARRSGTRRSLESGHSRSRHRDKRRSPFGSNGFLSRTARRRPFVLYELREQERPGTGRKPFRRDGVPLAAPRETGSR